MKLEKTIILNTGQIEQKINRLAYEIYESFYTEKEIIIVGISGQGYSFAKRIFTTVKKISPLKIHLVKMILDKKNPLKKQPQLNMEESSFKGKVVLLIDDVLNTGKTLIYGAKTLLDFQVKQLTTVVLVNRRHRLFPIRADLVGLTLATTMQEHINVVLEKGKEAVYLE